MYPKTKRVFYFAPAATQDLARKYQSGFYVGAASNKVFGVAAALRSAGWLPIVCSTALSAKSVLDGGIARHHKTRDAVYARIFAFGSGPLRRLISGFSYMFYAQFYIRKCDHVILYNFFPEYLFLSLFRWMIGRPVILDIEDAPRGDEKGARAVVGRICYRALRAISADFCLAASITTVRDLSFAEVQPVYGVSSYFAGKAKTRFEGETVRVLFGGEIIPETGLCLFRDALKLLAAQRDLAVHFSITGRFNPRDFHEVQALLKASGIELSLHEELGASDYQALLEEIDVGLCLKLTSTSMGGTTFPSKVVEYAAKGLLVCSTSVSDVPLLFNETNACILMDESPGELARCILEFTQNREQWRQKAQRGHLHIASVLSKQVVGESLDRLLSFSDVPRAANEKTTQARQNR